MPLPEDQREAARRRIGLAVRLGGRQRLDELASRVSGAAGDIITATAAIARDPSSPPRSARASSTAVSARNGRSGRPSPHRRRVQGRRRSGRGARCRPHLRARPSHRAPERTAGARHPALECTIRRSSPSISPRRMPRARARALPGHRDRAGRADLAHGHPGPFRSGIPPWLVGRRHRHPGGHDGAR